MRSIKPIILGIVVLFAGIAIWLAYSGNPEAVASSEDLVKRGEYLVTIGGCNDCHTPLKMTAEGPRRDQNWLLAGHPADLKVSDPPYHLMISSDWSGAFNSELTAWAGPWGVSFAANLTPDQVTGIGSWNEQVFIQALRTGKHMGAGRPILPPMPWENLSQVSDEDLRAIFYYLRSLKPVENMVPPPIPPSSK